MTDQLNDSQRRRRVHAALDRLQKALLDHDMGAFADEWAPDGSMDFPFAPPGWPHLQSRDEVRNYLASFTDNVDIRGIRHQRRHDTTDPDTVIVEWGVTGVAVKTGRPYDIDYVAFITAGSAGITAYRDYWNPLAAGTAMGSLDDMIAAFAAT